MRPETELLLAIFLILGSLTLLLVAGRYLLSSIEDHDYINSNEIIDNDFKPVAASYTIELALIGHTDAQEFSEKIKVALEEGFKMNDSYRVSVLQDGNLHHSILLEKRTYDYEN